MEMIKDRESDFLYIAFTGLCCVLGIYSFYVFYERFSYLIILGSNPAAVASVSHEGGIYIITMMAHFPVIGALVAMMKKYRFRWFLFVANVLPLMLWFAVMGRKALLVEFLICATVVYHYHVRPLRFRQLAGLGAIFLFLVSMSFFYRNLGLSNIDKWKETFSSKHFAFDVLIQPIIERSYHFDMFLLVLDKVKGFGDLKFGGTMQELLFFFVPRSLWQAKPLAFGYTFGLEFLDQRVYYQTSFATSLLGELFLNFHVFGIAAGCFVIGVLLRTVHRAFAKSGTFIGVVIYSVLYFRMVHLIEGPIASHVIFTITSLLPVMLLVAMKGVYAAVRGRR
jgi:hypothetical protein